MPRPPVRETDALPLHHRDGMLNLADLIPDSVIPNVVKWFCWHSLLDALSHPIELLSDIAPPV